MGSSCAKLEFMKKRDKDLCICCSDNAIISESSHMMDMTTEPSLSLKPKLTLGRLLNRHER